MLFRHGILTGIGFGHEHGLDHRRIATGAAHKLKHGIERSTVGTARPDHGLQRLDIAGKAIMGHAGFMRPHPVGVALERIDLAVMGQNAERLGQ